MVLDPSSLLRQQIPTLDASFSVLLPVSFLLSPQEAAECHTAAASSIFLPATTVSMTEEAAASYLCAACRVGVWQ